MHQVRIRFMLVATTTVLTIALSLCISGAVGASPMTTQPKAHPPSKLIGQQAHVSSTSTARATSPNVTIVCDIFDYAHASGQNFYPQVRTECPVPATIDEDVYIDYCSYWNYSEYFCAGSWNRGGSGWHCDNNSTAWTCPPGSGIAVSIPPGNAVRGDYVVTTVIPNTTNPGPQTYYGYPYTF